MTYSRLGADIGGTFTDFVLSDATGEHTLSFKTPSTPADPARAIRNGIEQMVELYGVAPGDVDYFVHGTTLGVNTLIQRTGSTTGLLVTKGFRDVLEIGRLRLPDPTNYFVEKTPPLAARRRVREIDERMLASGEVLTPLDTAEVHRAVEELVALGTEAVAVCFMHSYRNPAHEDEAVAYIRDAFPGVYVCGSSEIWPQQREYERALVAVINAFIGRRMAEYFERLDGHVKELGMPAPILTTKSNGGIMTGASAREVPVETLLSGPASGVIGAMYVGRLSGHESLIAFDMGGTSADVAVIDRDVLYSTESSVGDYPILIPAVDVSSIGAGGGSVAWIDPLGILKVGPRSAGADPGPACYGRGGVEPAVTDAYVQLGMIRPETFLGGRLVLDPALAEQALRTLGEPLGLDATAAADGVLEVTTANMQAQLMPLMARRGIDPRDFAMLAYGGAGPTHALLLAREIGVRQVIVPPTPGTLSALGSLVADIKRDSIKTLYAAADELSPAALEDEFTALELDARSWLEAQRAPVESTLLLRSADMRYKGQSFDMTVPLPGRLGADATMDEVRAPFHDAYERIYGFADHDAPVEVINLRVTVVGVTPKPQLAPPAAPATPSAARARAERTVYEDRAELRASVFARSELAPGSEFAGPAIVEAADTTVYIPAGFSVQVDQWSNLIAEGGR
jgi:N-methylhydantoinase A